MKITTEDNVDEFILDRVNAIYITFDDKEIKLNHIIDYDIDLDRVDSCIIGFTNVLQNKEIINRFKRNNDHISFIHIEGEGVVVEDYKKIDLYYDIPCDMKIRRMRIDGDNNHGNMFIELEGVLK